MNVYATEDEQVEAIKKWWKENAKSVLGGVLIGVAVIYGGKLWLDQRNNHVEAASAEYEAMLMDLNQEQNVKAAERGALILGQYDDTAYAELASLVMARIKVEDNDLAAAKSHLGWALDNAKQEHVKQIARLRLAQVLHSEESYAEALQLINGVNAGKYLASYEELKGDIFVAQGELAQARTAYTIALDTLEPGSRLRRYLEMKLDDLGEAASPAAQS